MKLIAIFLIAGALFVSCTADQSSVLQNLGYPESGYQDAVNPMLINLDLPMKQRFQEVGEKFKSEIQAFSSYISK